MTNEITTKLLDIFMSESSHTCRYVLLFLMEVAAAQHNINLTRRLLIIKLR